MNYDVIVKNARIPQGNDTVVTNILVKDEKIAGFTLPSLDAYKKIANSINDPHLLFDCNTWSK